LDHLICGTGDGVGVEVAVELGGGNVAVEVAVEVGEGDVAGVWVAVVVGKGVTVVLVGTDWLGEGDVLELDDGLEDEGVFRFRAKYPIPTPPKITMAIITIIKTFPIADFESAKPILLTDYQR
jgi:hypothetical protein